MIDYNYYVNEFGGSKLSVLEFNSTYDKALRYVKHVISRPAEESEIADAVCATCEHFFYADQRSGIKSESIDSQSITYDTPKTDSELFSLLKLYISPDLLYRGLV